MLWLALVGLTDHLVHNRIKGGSQIGLPAGRSTIVLRSHAWPCCLLPASQQAAADIPSRSLPRTHCPTCCSLIYCMQPRSMWSTTCTTRPTLAAAATSTSRCEGR